MRNARVVPRLLLLLLAALSASASTPSVPPTLDWYYDDRTANVALLHPATGKNNGTLVHAESRPEEFKVLPHFKSRGVVLPKYDTWIATIRCLGNLALAGWNTPLEKVECTTIPNVDIILIENRAAEIPLRAKEVMWALLSVSFWWERRQDPHYAETNFAMKVADTQIGVGQVKAKTTSTTYPSWDPRLKIRASFSTATDPVCAPFEFYKVLMFFLTDFAELNPSAPFLGLKKWFPGPDITFYIGPTSDAAGQEGRFSLQAAVVTLVTMGQWMATAVPEKRFHTFEGVVNWRGPIVGKMSLTKGKGAERVEQRVVEA